MKLAKIIFKLILVWIAGIIAISYIFQGKMLLSILVGVIYGYVIGRIISETISLLRENSEPKYVFIREEYEEDDEEEIWWIFKLL